MGQRPLRAHRHGCVRVAVGPDQRAEQAGEMPGDALDGSGNIVVVEGKPGCGVSIPRKNCPCDKTADDDPDVMILDGQTAAWTREKAQTPGGTVLSRFGDAIDGVHAFADGMGLGVISALPGAGKAPGEVKIVTCTQFGAGWDAMQPGWHSGSHKPSPIDDAVLAIQTGVKVANGIVVPDLQGIARQGSRPRLWRTSTAPHGRRRETMAGGRGSVRVRRLRNDGIRPCC